MYMKRLAFYHFHISVQFIYILFINQIIIIIIINVWNILLNVRKAILHKLCFCEHGLYTRKKYNIIQYIMTRIYKNAVKH